MEKMSTTRNILSVGLFPGMTANDLNTIINQADGQTSTRKDANSFARIYKVNRRINWELERRGIDYRVSKCFCGKGCLFMCILIVPMFILMAQTATGMNLLSADYNQRGC